MTSEIVRATLVVSETTAVALVVKATVILAAGLFAAWLLRRAAASVRALVLASTFVVLALLPIVAILSPPLVVAVPTTATGSFAPEAAPWPAPETYPAFTARPVEALSEAVTPPPAAPAGGAIDAGMMLWVGWLLGVMLTLLPVAGTLWRLRTIRRTSVPWIEGEVLTRPLASEAGIRRSIAVLRHEAVRVPMTCGVLRPALVLPWDAPAWSRADLERAFVHEIEHVRRGDWFVILFARLVCAAWWFHPLVWIAWRRLWLETERACDDAVVRRAEASTYARQLVSLAQRLSAGVTPAMLAMASRSNLAIRVHAVLDAQRPRRRAGGLAGAIIFAGAGLVAATVAPLHAVPTVQDARPGPLRFAVASVKRNTSGAPLQGGAGGIGAGGAGAGVMLGVRPGTDTFSAINVPLREIVRYAFRLEPFQPIQGAPRWLDDRYDIVARMQEPSATSDMAALMLQQLLAERFQLSVQWAERQQPAYALVLARADGRLGPALARSTTDCDIWDAERRDWMQTLGGRQLSDEERDRYLLRPPCTMVNQPFVARIHGGATTMADFARLLSRLPGVGAPVVDRTRLTGAFDFEVTYAPMRQQSLHAGTPGSAGPPTAGDRDPAADLASVEPALPSLAVALEEQLGLRLESIRGSVSLLVIERIERPDED